MSYCPHCKKSVNVLEKKKLSKQLAKGALGATNSVTRFALDESERESDRQDYRSGNMSRAEVRRRHDEREDFSNMSTNISQTINNKSTDLLMGPDSYFSCEECNLEVEFPNAHSKPEYLQMRYDAGSATSKKVFGILVVLLSFGPLKAAMGSGVKPSLIALALGAVAYFSVNFIPFKPRGIINLLSENIKTLFGAVCLAGIVLTIGLFGIDSFVSKGTFQDIVAIIWMLAVGACVVFGIFQLNKTRWAEIKETWALMDQYNNSDNSPSEQQSQQEDETAA